MKNKIFITIAVVVGLMNQVYAQRHELTIGAGALSRPFIKECANFRKVMGKGPDHYSYSGTFQLNYYFRLAKGYSIGATLLYEQQQHDKTANYPYTEDRRHIYRERYLSLLASQKYAWVRSKWISLYSALDLGVCLVDRKESRNDFSYLKDEFTETRFAYQATPFGIRAGQRLGGYMELGYGYKGIAAIGFSYRF